MRRITLAVIATALLIGPGNCLATVVYSNLGSGDSFGPGYYDVEPGYVLGFLFRPNSNQNIRSFEVPLSPRTHDPTSVTVSIHMRGGSSAFPTVGWLVESFQVPVWGYYNDGPHHLAAVDLSGNARLLAGVYYWVLISQPTLGFYWSVNSTSVLSTTYYNGHIVNNEDQGAFRITSDFITAEPGTLALLGLGLAGLGLSRRRRLN